MAVTLCFSGLSGCALFAAKSQSNNTELFSPVSLGYSVSALQHIQATFMMPTAATDNPSLDNTQTTRRAFQVLVEVDPNRIELVALSAQGMNLFSVSLDATQQLTVERNRLLDPAMEQYAVNVLRDFQRAYWPLSSWQHNQTALMTNNEAGETALEPNNLTRVIMINDQPGVQIQYASDNRWEGITRLTNLTLGYELVINTLESNLEPPQ